jgi:Mannosyltransferase (PIG-V)
VAPRRTWLFVLAVWLSSRAFFFLVGAAGHAWIREADITVDRPPSGSLSYWASWDGVHFIRIAQHGYVSEGETSFFPLYPLLMRPLTWLGFSETFAGLLLSFVASFFVLLFFHELARALRGERVARLATVALALFPTALFLNAVYSEAVFLALSGGCLWALYVERDPLNAGLLGYFAVLTRSFGVLLVLAIGWEWMRERREYGWGGLVGVVAPLIGLATYSFYLWRVARKPLLFNIAYERWGRSRKDPVTTLVRAFRHADDGVQYLVHPGRLFGTTSLNPPFWVSNTVGFATAVVLLALIAAAITRLPLGLLLYSVASTLVPMSLPNPGLPLVGLPRYAVAVLPLFIVLGVGLARSRAFAAVWYTTSVALGVYLTLEFVTFRWVA